MFGDCKFLPESHSIKSTQPTVGSPPLSGFLNDRFLLRQEP